MALEENLTALSISSQVLGQTTALLAHKKIMTDDVGEMQFVKIALNPIIIDRDALPIGPY